jgi:E3 ubiquitin-protein ligase TRIP12
LAELLLFKLPAIYTRSFQREGVFYEIDKLAGEELSLSARSKRKEAAQTKSSTKPDVESASQSGATDADKADGTPKATTSASTTATPSALLKALAGDDSNQMSAFERALGIARAKPGSSSRRVSSVPSNPHDANIVRAKILQIKRWSLSDTGRAIPSGTSGVAEVIQQLSDSEITDSDLQKAFKKIAELLTDKVEPLSSFEMLQSGLLAKLMAMLQEGEKGMSPVFLNVLGPPKPGQLSCFLRPAVAHRNILFEALAETPVDSESSPLALLVKRLQDSLSRLDNFEVETTNGAAETGKPSCRYLPVTSSTH